jgi:hypothetical protein
VGTDTGSATRFESVCNLFEFVAVDVMAAGGWAVNEAVNEVYVPELKPDIDAG